MRVEDSPLSARIDQLTTEFSKGNHPDLATVRPHVEEIEVSWDLMPREGGT